MFTLTIRAEDGPVPLDTSVQVSWSAGHEPPFVLDEPMTWMMPSDANVVCDVDRDKPPPESLAALVCHLWTSGATLVEIRAQGYAPYQETLVPVLSEVCNGPLPEALDITLEHATNDGSDTGL